MPKLYEVGGCVRDEFLGIQSDDIDFTFVVDDLSLSVEEGFENMTSWLNKEKFKIFLSTPEMFTIRAKFPDEIGTRKNLVADFVMARKEVGYVEGTRRPILKLGTLADDLVRRDFTVNAMAKDEEGNLIDLFNGQEDLKVGILNTPLDPMITFMDDPLRMLRAMRFSITKNLTIAPRVWDAIAQPGLIQKMKETTSQERIAAEITKAMKFNTLETLRVIAKVDEHAPGFMEAVVGKGLWFKPTFEKKRKD